MIHRDIRKRPSRLERIQLRQGKIKKRERKQIEKEETEDLFDENETDPIITNAANT